MKKLICIALSIIVLTIGVYPCFAFAADDDYKVYLDEVKRRIPSTDEYDKFRVNSYGNDGDKVFNFYWSTSGETCKHLTVSINSENVITEYYQYCESDRNSDKISYDQAYATACDGVRTLNPHIADKLVVERDYTDVSVWSYEYTYNVYRVENGIKVKNNGGRISVSTDGKRICDMYINYTAGLNFDKPDQFIDKQTAIEAFTDKIGMNLEYRNEYSDGKMNIIAVYTDSSYGLKYIDATTGEVVEGDNYFEAAMGSRSDKLSYNGEMAEDTAEMYSEAEIAEMTKIDNLMSSQAIIDSLRKNSLLKIGKKYTVDYFNLGQSYDEEKYFYNIRFENDDDCDIYVRVNAKDGKIMNYSRYTDYSDKKIPEKQLVKLADSAAAKLSPQYFKSTENADFEIDKDSIDSCSVAYIRKVNGVPYRNNRLYMSFDPQDYSLTRYYVTYTDNEFPNINGVIGQKQAASKMLEQVGYEICYRIFADADGNKTTRAVYDISDLVYDTDVDAFTGELINKRNNSKNYTYDDIENHYAKQAIEALAAYGIGFDSKDFCPDSFVTYQDLAELLQKAIVDVSYYDDFYKELGYGEVDLNTYVKRGEFAKIIALAQGYDEIAGLNGIYLSPFKDVMENIGYAAILYAKGIVNGDEYNNFNPDQNLLRGDCAIVISKLLKLK